MFDNSYEELHRSLAIATSNCFATHTMTETDETGAITQVYSDSDRDQTDAVLIELIKEAIDKTEQKRVGVHKSNYADMIKWGNDDINNPKYNESKHSYLNLFNRYSGQVPIFARKTLSKRFDHKVNNKINNDFFSEIIDDKVSFTMGKSPVYMVTEGDELIKEELTKFIDYNNLGAFDRDTFLISSICGVAYRVYTPAYNKDEMALEIVNIAPWNVIFFQETEYIEAVAIILGESNKEKIATVFYNGMSLSINLKSNTVAAQQTAFKMPVVEYVNNNLKISDCDKVLELIDAYDRLISDTSNELEQMRLAYLTISGGQRLTREEAKEFKTQLQDAGVLHLPDGVTANFLIKTVDMTSVLNFLTVIENNIYRFSKSINYANSKFTGGQLTGIALKQATINLRNKCLTSWLSFDDANYYQWQIMSEFIQAKYAMITEPNFKIEGYIKLNIPTDNKEIADTMQTFKGSLSTKTILRLAELDLDVDQEYEEMAREGLVEENKENPRTGFINE